MEILLIVPPAGQEYQDEKHALHAWLTGTGTFFQYVTGKGTLTSEITYAEVQKNPGIDKVLVRPSGYFRTHRMWATWNRGQMPRTAELVAEKGGVPIVARYRCACGTTAYVPVGLDILPIFHKGEYRGPKPVACHLPPSGWGEDPPRCPDCLDEEENNPRSGV